MGDKHFTTSHADFRELSRLVVHQGTSGFFNSAHVVIRFPAAATAYTKPGLTQSASYASSIHNVMVSLGISIR